MTTTTKPRGRAAGSGTHYEFLLRRPGAVDPDTAIRLPSVTHVLGALNKPALVHWASATTITGVVTLGKKDGLPDPLTETSLKAALKAAKLRPYDLRDTAAGRGSDAHRVLERLVEGKKPSGVLGPFSVALLGWWGEREPKVQASEEVVYSLRHGYAGTVDLVTDDAVLDLKTRKATDSRGKPTTAYETDYLQTAAYRLAWQEMHGDTPPHTRVLVVRDDGTWGEYDGDPDRDEQAFLRLLDVYRWMEGRK